MPRKDRQNLFDRAKKLGIRIYRFYRWMEEIQAAADLVVSMGGYNTVCEILTPGIPALLVPRENPRKEQLIRAEVLHSKNLLDYIPWHACTPEALRQKILTILENPKIYLDAIAQFELTGLETIHSRLQAFNNSPE